MAGLFGGGTTTTGSKTQPPAFQMPYIEQLFSEAKNLYGSPGPTFFPGSTVAGFTPAQREGQQSLLDFSTGYGQNAANAALSGLQFGLGNFLDVNKNPYLPGYVEAATRPITQSLTESILPSLRSTFDTSGGLDSTRRALAEGQAARAGTQAIGDVTTNILSNAYQSGLAAYGQLLGLAPSIQAMGAVPGETQRNVGAEQRALNQQQINEAIARHEFEQNLPYAKLTEYANLVRSPLGAEGASEVVAPELGTPEQIASLVTTLLPLIGQLTSIFGGG